MKMTITKKLISGFLAIVLLLGMVSGISYFFFNRMKSSYEDVLERRLTALVNAKNIQVNAVQQNSSLRGYILNSDPNTLKNLQTANANLNELASKGISLVNSADQKETLQKMIQINREYKEKSDQILTLLQSNRDEAIALLNQQVIPLGREMGTQADAFADRQQKLMDEAHNEVKKQMASTVAIMMAISGCAVILAIVIGLTISRMISKPITAMSGIAERIAAGDLTAEDIQVKNRDEIGVLARSFNQMKKNLQELIRQARLSAEQVAASSEELTASAEQTSQATSQIASTIQEVAAGSHKQAQSVAESSNSIRDMSDGIQQIAANAQSVSINATQAMEIALEGNKGIQTAIHQMNSIHTTVHDLAQAIRGLGERSQEIGKILEVITDIATQTNMLALNAAIEAARAGEYGRGFAVVSDEVRKLAEQSAESVKQIARLIHSIQEETHQAVHSMEKSIQEVSAGIDLVHAAGTSFDQIRRSVQEVANQIQEVAALSQQISAGSQQVVQSIQFIAEIAETNASGTQNISSAVEEQFASMEEITSSATSLSQMAEELQSLIGRFKV